jgi:hypothetical protein
LQAASDRAGEIPGDGHLKQKGEEIMLSDRIMRYINLKNLIFFLSIVMFFWLAWYFYTGFGGPTELVAHLVPIALMLQTSDCRRSQIIS